MMTLATGFLLLIAALTVWATTAHMQAMLARHEAALAAMRKQLRVYEAVCRAQGDAERVFIRHGQGTRETWVDLVLAIDGLSLRHPIRPEEMERFIADLRAAA